MVFMGPDVLLLTSEPPLQIHNMYNSETCLLTKFVLLWWIHQYVCIYICVYVCVHMCFTNADLEDSNLDLSEMSLAVIVGFGGCESCTLYLQWSYRMYLTQVGLRGAQGFTLFIGPFSVVMGNCSFVQVVWNISNFYRLNIWCLQ